jgi:hypothetical protein
VIYRFLQSAAAVALVLGAVGAGISPNVTSPLTNVPVTVAIINTTPYRAIFTVGAYENLDQNTIVEPSTVLLESQANDTTHLGTTWLRTARIIPGAATPVLAGCRRAISIGGPEMLSLINKQKAVYTNTAIGITLDDRALVPGVYFSDAALDSPDAEHDTVGRAAPLTLLQGVDFPCGSYVILRLVADSTVADGFRVQFDGVIY